LNCPECQCPDASFEAFVVTTRLLPGIIGVVPSVERSADGGLRIRGACRAETGPTMVWPVTVPGGRTILVAERRGRARRFDAQTGEAIGDPGQPWRVSPFACTAATVRDGRTILVAAGEDGIARFDVVTGVAYPPAASEQPFTIWDVAAARLPGGRVIIAGAGHDWLVYRWDAATGEAIGEPLERHRRSVKAVTAAVAPDGAPMFISGCEDGTILCWDAATGALIGEPLRGAIDVVLDLAVAGLPDGRQLLTCVDTHALHCWDLATGEPLVAPAGIGRWGQLVAARADSQGTPTAIVWMPGEGKDKDAVERVEQWRLDTGTRMEISLPVALRAVFDAGGRTWMVLGEPDGSLVIRPLPRAPLPG
jgi:hypothetical protein